MTIFENSGIQTGLCGNLVCERYVNKKKPYKVIYQPFFFAVCCHGDGAALSGAVLLAVTPLWAGALVGSAN